MDDLIERIAYRKVKLDVETEGNLIVGVDAIIDIEYIDIDSYGAESDPLKLATVCYSAHLAQRAYWVEWSCSCHYLLFFSKADQDELPEWLVETGPGYFVTAASQALLGTKFGLRALGLGNYTLPDDWEQAGVGATPTMIHHRKAVRLGGTARTIQGR